MDSAATALNSLFSKVPAPGTRDGTSIADTETGQNIAKNADQASEKLSEAANSASAKAKEVANSASEKTKEVADSASEKTKEVADSASAKANETADSAKGKANEAASPAKGTANDAASSAKAKANDTADSAKGTANNATSGTTTSASGSTAEHSTTSVDKVTEETETVADQTVAPAVEHDTIKREHETRDRDVVEKEIHKDHYHTTIQPLKDTEVQATQHEFEQAPTEYRSVDKDDGAAEAKVAKKLAGFHDSVKEEETKEMHAQDETVVGEHVHHHLHEIIQPVIEKEVIQKSVTHVTHPIKETVHEKSDDHGVTKAKPISVEEFKHRLDGEAATEVNPDKPAP
ncbi:hypothetical protein LTR35_000452 [Friedmanniomyces endolithicus]|uniref:Allergen n=1 Tax=Friedmanniomyces endolithicus TaxID=329885 RepID=A0AAN6FUB1_9PEZI|nr:hypothetical protein LTS00_009294 [Friedmanniomyces endolithicus]KAK0293845.1 hypothetical protein LTR35_000452 [Friedmanniomyces endolithicus]KAK0324359.1 hypothetical protein LTR82_004798 [Friedmanniomyces endolithicus]KAK0991708.1 hypothetical protein LTR54_011628 [Friedmanniomyces endolithicus]